MALRNRLAETQAWRCIYCEGEMRVAYGAHDVSAPRVTLEHLVEHHLGGELTEDNCAAACAACNSRRPAISAQHYYAVRQSLLHVWPQCTYANRDVSNYLNNFKGVSVSNPQWPLWRKLYGRMKKRLHRLIRRVLQR